jgi:hypothetical protein
MKAFPSKEPIYGANVVGVKENSGMDLRDYFAGLAMQAIMVKNDFEWVDEAWENAYDAADEMMKAREKK